MNHINRGFTLIELTLALGLTALAVGAALSAAQSIISAVATADAENLMNAEADFLFAKIAEVCSIDSDAVFEHGNGVVSLTRPGGSAHALVGDGGASVVSFDFGGCETVALNVLSVRVTFQASVGTRLVMRSFVSGSSATQ